MKIAVDDPRLRHAYGYNSRDVRRYANLIRRGSTPPAIVLGNHGSRFAVHDGAHRLDAGREAGLATIDAFVGTPREAGEQERDE